MAPSHELVRHGYDRIAEAYLAERVRFDSQAHLERFAALLRPGARVLDIGCGAGVPADHVLVDRGFEVVGLDVSPRQIELARVQVPEATYAVRDMLELTVGEYAVAAVISLYAVFHVPRERHGGVLTTLASYVPRGGALLVTMGTSAWEGTADLCGAPMWWSHHDAETNEALIRAAGFDILSSVVDTSAGERHLVVLGRKVRETRQRPSKRGGRFSLNAATASAWSRLR